MRKVVPLRLTRCQSRERWRCSRSHLDIEGGGRPLSLARSLVGYGASTRWHMPRNYTRTPWRRGRVLHIPMCPCGIYAAARWGDALRAFVVLEAVAYS